MRNVITQERRIQRYAAKFAADTISQEPPRTVAPTLDNIAHILRNCVRPPHAEELESIRQRFVAEYGDEYKLLVGGSRRTGKDMIYTVTKPEDRRDLDDFVRSVYDRVSEAGDQMSKQTYSALIRGGSNALHRFGSIIVPRVSSEFSGEPHVIELAS